MRRIWLRTQGRALALPQCTLIALELIPNICTRRHAGSQVVDDSTADICWHTTGSGVTALL